MRIEKNETTTILYASGDIDLSNSRDLQTEIRSVMRDSPSKLIVDLEGVPYMDSSGVATLVEAMQLARKANTSLVLSGMKDKVLSIFEIARLDKVFAITDTLEQAQSL